MPVGETMSFADITEGTRVAMEVTDSFYEPDGMYGPQLQVDHEVLKPEQYAGGMVRSWYSLSQPRLNKVRNLRADGIKDDAIAASLREKGFTFENIDDPEDPKIGGALKQALLAGLNNDRRAYRKLLNECDNFDEIADAMIGMRYTAEIRHDNKGRSKIDGKAAFHPHVETKPVDGKVGGHSGEITKEDEEDFDDVPF